MRHDPARRRSGPDATASSSRPGTRASSSTPRCTSAGYDLTLDDLKQFRQWGSRTPGHPELPSHAGDRDDDGPARAGRWRTRSAWRSPSASSPTATTGRATRSSTHRVYGICSDGDLMEGVSQEAASIAGQLGLGKPRLRLRRQPHHDRRHDGASASTRGHGRALRGVRLARAARRRRERPRRASRGDRGGAERDGAALADRRPLPHRLPGAERDGHGQGARRAARRGRGARDEGGPRLGSGRAVPRARRGARAHGRRRRAGHGRARGVGGASSRPGARHARTSPRSASASSTGARATAGSTRCPSFEAGDEIATRDAGEDRDAGAPPVHPDA